MKIHYSPSVGINLISKTLANSFYPNTSLTPSQKRLQTSSGTIIESNGVLSVIPIRINNFEICLYFHIYDTSDITLLIGRPIIRLIQEKPLQGHSDFKVGNSTINIHLAHSINTIMEPKYEQDSIEEVLMASLENMA